MSYNMQIMQMQNMQMRQISLICDMTIVSGAGDQFHLISKWTKDMKMDISMS